MAELKPEATKPWPMNAWYAASWNYEIKRQLTPRTICGKDIVLYRRTDGQVVALEDACWHRLLPLSLGHLNGDQVVCGYHGLVFNSVGRCTYMPAQETINPSACVQAFPTVERYRLIWVWMGDPALADPDKIPDFHWNSDEPWVGEGGTFYSLKCDYRLVIDNLMDLTHETYVHAGSIGDDAITRNPFEVTHTDRKVTVSRWMENIEPPPFWAASLASPATWTAGRSSISKRPAWWPAMSAWPLPGPERGTATAARASTASSSPPSRRNPRQAAITSGTSSAASAPTIRA